MNQKPIFVQLYIDGQWIKCFLSVEAARILMDDLARALHSLKLAQPELGEDRIKILVQ